MFLGYVIWYGLGRAVIEGMRTDSLYFFGTGIRSSQMLGILSAVVGIGLYVLRLKTAGPASPPFQPAAEAETAQAVVEDSPEPVAENEPEEFQPEQENKEERQDGGDLD